MFRPIDKKRLMELAGIAPIQHGPEDRSKSPLHQDTDVDAGLGDEGEGTEEHLEKETSVFDTVNNALEELLDFLQSQEGFEEKRGKEDEYRQMEQDAKALKDCMQKHLSEYDPEQSEGEDEHGDMDKPDVMRMVK